MTRKKKDNYNNRIMMKNCIIRKKRIMKNTMTNKMKQINKILIMKIESKMSIKNKMMKLTEHNSNLVTIMKILNIQYKINKTLHNNL